MPTSKLRKAIGAVKDQTSISLAKVTSTTTTCSTIGIAILKATTHEDAPVDPRHIQDLLLLLSSGTRTSTIACVEALSRRIARTRNWVVALKSLLLLLSLLRSGHPLLPSELLRSLKRSPNNLSSFTPHHCTSSSSSSHFTSFIQSFALYLDERLSFLRAGKLTPLPHPLPKPALLLDRISCWQRLLDRVLATRAEGEAKKNRLVRNSIHEIAKESFELYGDISRGLVLILDRFFSLPRHACLVALRVCVKAERQFEELCGFYGMCRSMGVGEYPTVKKISTELIDTLKKFVKDGGGVDGGGRWPSLSSLLRQGEKGSSDFGRRKPSLEDLFSVTEPGTSFTSSWRSGEHGRSFSANELGALDSWPEEEGYNNNNNSNSNMMGKATSVDSLYAMGKGEGEDGGGKGECCWEVMLVESVAMGGDCRNSCLNNGGGGITCSYKNPFVEEGGGGGGGGVSGEGDCVFTVAPTFQAVPSIWGGGGVSVVGDPFAEEGGERLGGGRSSILNEQMLWVERQNKIMAKHWC